MKGMMEPNTGNLVAVGLGKKAMLVSMSNQDADELTEGINLATARVREVLRKESG